MRLSRKIFITVIFLIFTGQQNIFAQNELEKPTYVLVHGAWHGGWSWQMVSQELRENDFNVYTPSLSGLGEHKNIATENITLETHISDIVNLIEMEDLYNVILVGHSYSGTVIAGVADRIPNRLSKLIFLDAMLVHDGESPLSLQPKEARISQEKLVRKKQNIPPFPVALFGVTDSLQAKWVTERLTPQPFNTFAQELSLENEYGNGLPLIYIACTNPWLPILKKMSKEAKNNPSWSYFELNTGHDAMLLVPDELSNLLVKLSK
ncbi:alpha/beta hydrolase [Autumnicola musiva]|uniref:Alpha/beta hydrolase n=1 Tax=Autumnicola musiva TaxID=3075589 RepID=A0ABU3DB54_9FLAO|nr:alpha/beta hydrolase [Zunongwangia sp. F117]MDT0678767.1 alpha/beta hydrolase [Zunongwangia sp. F117]